MRTALKDRKRQFRNLYEELWDELQLFIEVLRDQLAEYMRLNLTKEDGINGKA